MKTPNIKTSFRVQDVKQQEGRRRKESRTCLERNAETWMNPFKYRNQPAEAFLWSISHHLLQPESRWINENVSETMWNISESSCCFKEKSNNKNRFRKQLKIYKKRKDGAILVSSVTASSQSEHSRTDRKEHKVTDASSPRLSLLFVPRMQEASDGRDAWTPWTPSLHVSRKPNRRRSESRI